MFPVYKLAFHNGTPGPLDGFMIQFNKNALGLAPTSQAVQLQTNPPGTPLMPGQSAPASLPLAISPGMVAPGRATALLQVDSDPYSFSSPANLLLQRHVDVIESNILSMYAAVSYRG